METSDVKAKWQQQAEEVVANVAQWREKHPKATLAQIEQAVDEQMNRLRAQLIEQAAQLSEAAGHQAAQGLVCEHCGQPLQARGQSKRQWQTQGGKPGGNRTELCQLPPMWRRLFPPWITNWRCQPAISYPMRCKCWCA